MTLETVARPGDLVLAQHLEELQVAEVSGAGGGEPGTEGLQHPGQFQRPPCGGEPVAAGEGEGGAMPCP